MRQKQPVFSRQRLESCDHWSKIRTNTPWKLLLTGTVPVARWWTFRGLSRGGGCHATHTCCSICRGVGHALAIRYEGCGAENTPAIHPGATACERRRRITKNLPAHARRFALQRLG